MNRKRTQRAGRGMTLMELTIAMATSSVLFLAIMNMLAASQKQFNQTYDRVTGNVVNDSYVARRVFDRIIRKASADYTLPSEGPSTSIEVRFYSTTGLSAPDQFAKFEWDSGTQTLLLSQGDIGTTPAGLVIARNVTSCTFDRSGKCIHMALILDDGTTNQTVTVTATRHNQG
jgi:Tfp pilus assembly protein PilW